MLRSFPVVALVVLFSGCESTTEVGKMTHNPTPHELLLPVQEANFRLTSSDKQALPAALDSDAVEEFLSWVRPERRPEALVFIQQIGKAGNAVPQFTSDGQHPELEQIARRLVKRPGRVTADTATKKTNEP